MTEQNSATIEQSGASGGERDKRLLWLMALCAGILILPTAALLINSGFSSESISANISDAWHGGLWLFLKAAGLNLPKKIVALLADGFSWLCIGGITWIYLKIFLTRKKPRTKEKLPGAPRRNFYAVSGLGLLLLSVVPFHSRDIYGYINRGAQQAFYNINPYRTSVGEMPHWQADAIFQNHWVDNPCPYGFFYAKLAKGLAFLGGHDFFTSFLIFKLSALIAHLAITWLLYRFLIRLKRPAALWIASLYGMSPLILLQQIANGHNDGFLALGLLGALALLLQNRFRFLAWPALLLSVLTKYISLLAAPFMLLYALRQKMWKELALGALISLAILAALAFCYLQNWQQLPFDRMVENAGLSQHSIQSALVRVCYYAALPISDDPSTMLTLLREVFKQAFLGGFAIFYVIRVFRFWRFSSGAAHEDNTVRDALLYEISLVISVYLLVASAKFHAWYLGMILPIAWTLNPELPKHRRLMLVMFWVSVFQILAFTPLENIHVIGPTLLIILPIVLCAKFKKLDILDNTLCAKNPEQSEHL